MGSTETVDLGTMVTLYSLTDEVQDVHAIVVDRRRGFCTSIPTDPGVIRAPLLRPQNLAGLFIQREDALRSTRTGRPYEIGDEDPPVRNRRAG